MNHVMPKLDWYAEKSPKKATFVVLYGNLIMNIFYGIIYVLLHETLFPDTWNNVAVGIAFTETVILFYTVITVHDKKFFMLGWCIFVILLNSGFIIVHIIHLMGEHHNWTKCWDQYIYNIVINVNNQFGRFFSIKSIEILSKYLPPVVLSFISLTIIFKYYSAWTIYKSELRREMKTSMIDLFLFSEKRKSCQPVIISSA